MIYKYFICMWKLKTILHKLTYLCLLETKNIEERNLHKIYMIFFSPAVLLRYCVVYVLIMMLRIMLNYIHILFFKEINYTLRLLFSDKTTIWACMYIILHAYIFLFPFNLFMLVYHFIILIIITYY
jgi:hypothetical protein